MINGAIWHKSLHESRWLWLACATVLYFFCWFHVAVTSQVDMGRFETLLNRLPEQWEKFSPVPFKDLVSYPARIAVTYEEPLVYLMMTVWCLSRSSDVVSGELGRGTMEMLLAQPISRLQIIVTPIVMTLLGALLLAVVAWCGTTTGILTTSIERPAPGSQWTLPFTSVTLPWHGADAPTDRVPMRVLADIRMFLPAALNYFCLGVLLCGLGTLLSAVDRHRWRVLGFAVGFYVLQMLAEIVGQAFPSWGWVRHASFFSAYEPIRFVSTASRSPELAWSWFTRNSSGEIVDIGPLAGDVILAGLGLGAIVVGVWYFCRRDVPAPV